ncbi:MAG: winged helix-turn-helix transcriptional regulator [Myxococcales bacterium]|nr:winged helix-turn-helix transcriptional regulator [Myxococcales bacterium]
MSTQERVPLDPVLGFVADLWAVNHATERTSKRMEAVIGVTAQQRVLIRIVGRHPGISPGQLATTLSLDAGTISAAIRRLEARGLFERRRDPRDKRRVALGLTAAGRKLDVPSAGTVESAVALIIDSTPPEELAHVGAFLRRLQASLDEAAGSWR